MAPSERSIRPWRAIRSENIPSMVSCTAGQSAPYHFVVSYIINDTIDLDAGGLGFFCPLAEQEAIRNGLRELKLL